MVEKYIPPTNMDDYTERYVNNCHVEGFGIDTAQSFSCPFCAAPNWMTAKIINVEQDMERGATCSECGRSSRAIFTRSNGQVKFEFVQTGGDDQPDWLVPKMRRE